MLREVPEEIVIQKKGETGCRWFRDDYFDLFVWHDLTRSIYGFHLYYDIFRDQKAIFWDKKKGLSGHRVDEGENPAGKPKSTPIVAKEVDIHFQSIIKEFLARSTSIDSLIAAFVLDKLSEG